MRYLVLPAVVWVTLASFQASAAEPPSPAPDYADASNWACRPGKEDACTAGLDTMAVSADGQRTPQAFAVAADPAIDCFYVYPTVSREPTDYSDLAPSPEVMRAIRAEAGRLASRCRLFAPLYRQATLAHLRTKMDGGEAFESDMPYRDVVAAWDHYLAQDNHGRGVVLIGHSQGTILLQRLISERIDGKPAQAVFVSAFLAGDRALAVPVGARTGGTFAKIPTCSNAAQTGCVYVWSSYLSGDDAEYRIFSRNPGGKMIAACVNPAAPGGGAGDLKSYFPRPSMAPESDPDWVASIGQLAAECRSDDQGNVLRVSVKPGRYADLLQMTLGHVGHGGWGLHALDMALVQGNMIDLLGAQTASWQKTHR